MVIIMTTLGLLKPLVQKVSSNKAEERVAGQMIIDLEVEVVLEKQKKS